MSDYMYIHTHTHTHTYAQLEARLERMERRLAILQKRSRDVQSAADADTQLSSTSTATRTRLSRAEMVAASETHNRSRSSSVDTGRNRSRPPSHAGTPAPSDERDGGGSAKKAAKRRLKPSDLDDCSNIRKIKKKALKQKEIRTHLEYCGLNLPVPPPISEGNATTENMCNHNCESNGQDHDGFIAGMCSM